MSKQTHLAARSSGYLALALVLAGCLPQAVTTSQQSQLARTRCTTPAGVSGSPKNIAEAMALINALPKPTSVVCFLESLERPLTILATSNQLSGQPAAGTRSPRIFIIRPGLVISVVPAGASAGMVEFSESAPYAQSTKGEIAFPVLAALPMQSPYSMIRYGGGTSCSSCHQSETRIPDDSTHSQAFASNVIYPDPANEVSIQALIYYTKSCDPKAEPDRCAILSTVVGSGADIYRGSY